MAGGEEGTGGGAAVSLLISMKTKSRKNALQKQHWRSNSHFLISNTFFKIYDV